VSFDA